MVDQPKAGDDGPRREAGPAERSTERLARREQRRRQLRRRRLLAATGLAVVFAAMATIVAVIVGGGGGPNDNPGSGRTSSRIAGPTTTSTGGDAAGAGQDAGPVRNVTPQPDWRPYTGPVPILEWHVLGSPEPGVAYPELYVSRPDFRRQMNWLDDGGYEAVTLDQVEAAWWHDGTLPLKPVVLSFDDGYRPQFTFALPELRRHGWAGVLNLKAEGSDLYTSNVEAMIDAGWELASHTIDHSDLSTLGAAELEREVAGSREILRREYGVPVKSFCYPAGRYDDGTIAAVEAAGYTTATTQIPGYATREKPYELARLEVLGSSGVSGVADLLGAYEG